METTSPTNEELAGLLGVSHATVSRIRSGDRLPSLQVMQKIRELYGWTLDEQWDARNAGTYADQFCRTVDQGPVQPK
jgi:transcriptional regulator with XRE-family HTH domain